MMAKGGNSSSGGGPGGGTSRATVGPKVSAPRGDAGRGISFKPHEGKPAGTSFGSTPSVTPAGTSMGRSNVKPAGISMGSSPVKPDGLSINGARNRTGR